MTFSRLTLSLFLAPALLAQSGSAPEPVSDEGLAEVASEVVEPSAETSGVNLLGQADSEAGESRRNENVQFEPIDNNAFKESAIRLGTRATIVSEFAAGRVGEFFQYAAVRRA